VLKRTKQEAAPAALQYVHPLTILHGRLIESAIAFFSEEKKTELVKDGNDNNRTDDENKLTQKILYCSKNAGIRDEERVITSHHLVQYITTEATYLEQQGSVPT
jgi:hypothetical protein